MTVATTSQVRLLEVLTGPKPLLFLEGQFRLLLQRGFDLHLVSAAKDPRLHAFCQETGCRVHPVEISRSITPWSDLVTLRRLTRVMRAVRPTIVESHQSKAGLLGTLAAQWAGVPVRIYVNHGTAFASAQGWKRRLIKQGEQTTCRAATSVRFVSRSVRDLFVAEGCCTPAKIRPLVPSICGVDAKMRFNPACVSTPCSAIRQRHGIPADALVLGFVGRLIRIKGIETLVAAWQVLRERFPTSHLLIVGSYDDRDPVPPAIRQSMDSDPRAHLAGQIDDMPSYYAAMDVQVLPSHHEGLPVSLLEGEAMTLPIVASRIPGNVDAVEHGTAGTLVEPRDTAGFVAAITAYFRDPELRCRHGLAGRERMLREFRPEDVWEAVYRDYLNVLGRDGRR